MFKNLHCKLRDITSHKEERQKNKWKMEKRLKGLTTIKLLRLLQPFSLKGQDGIKN